MIVDAHQHFWDPAHADYPWMTDEVAQLRQRFSPDDLEPLLRAHGVSGTVVVQARHSLDESQALLAIATAVPFVLGVVGWVDLTADVERQLGDLDGTLVGCEASGAGRGRSGVASSRRRPARARDGW